MTSSTFDSPVTQLLSAADINYHVVEIPLSADKKPIRNLEALLSSQGLDPSAVVRSVVFKSASDQYVLLAAAGGGLADWAVLRKHLNARKCRMAAFAEVSEATGYVVGAVPPIALPKTVLTLVDHSVKGYETVVIGSGVLGYALSLKSADLLTVMADADQGDFTKSA